jgi:hypothetical protein
MAITLTWLRQTEHIHGYLWHRYSVTFHPHVNYSKLSAFNTYYYMYKVSNANSADSTILLN